MNDQAAALLQMPLADFAHLLELASTTANTASSKNVSERVAEKPDAVAQSCARFPLVWQRVYSQRYIKQFKNVRCQVSGPEPQTPAEAGGTSACTAPKATCEPLTAARLDPVKPARPLSPKATRCGQVPPDSLLPDQAPPKLGGASPCHASSAACSDSTNSLDVNSVDVSRPFPNSSSGELSPGRSPGDAPRQRVAGSPTAPPASPPYFAPTHRAGNIPLRPTRCRAQRYNALDPLPHQPPAARAAPSPACAPATSTAASYGDARGRATSAAMQRNGGGAAVMRADSAVQTAPAAHPAAAAALRGRQLGAAAVSAASGVLAVLLWLLQATALAALCTAATAWLSVALPVYGMWKLLAYAGRQAAGRVRSMMASAARAMSRATGRWHVPPPAPAAQAAAPGRRWGQRRGRWGRKLAVNTKATPK
eukprot:jgi/Ulvmu1/6512/UM003_0145.1